MLQSSALPASIRRLALLRVAPETRNTTCSSSFHAVCERNLVGEAVGDLSVLALDKSVLHVQPGDNQRIESPWSPRTSALESSLETFLV